MNTSFLSLINIFY